MQKFANGFCGNSVKKTIRRVAGEKEVEKATASNIAREERVAKKQDSEIYKNETSPFEVMNLELFSK